MAGLIDRKPGTLPWHSGMPNNAAVRDESRELDSRGSCLVVSFPAVSDVARHVYVDLDADRALSAGSGVIR